LKDGRKNSKKVEKFPTDKFDDHFLPLIFAVLQKRKLRNSLDGFCETENKFRNFWFKRYWLLPLQPQQKGWH